MWIPIFFIEPWPLKSIIRMSPSHFENSQSMVDRDIDNKCIKPSGELLVVSRCIKMKASFGHESDLSPSLVVDNSQIYHLALIVSVNTLYTFTSAKNSPAIQLSNSFIHLGVMVVQTLSSVFCIVLYNNVTTSPTNNRQKRFKYGYLASIP